MKTYKVTDIEFNEYGRVLEGYDYTKLFEKLKNKSIPDNGIVYVASDEELESCSEAKEMQLRGFGGYPIQLGYVAGKNREMNCLEYHKSSEFNIAADDIILILGKVQDISDEGYDSCQCKAFYVPAGIGVELYATTLHYAPFNVKDNGYRVICVLPRGTNAKKVEFEASSYEDSLCFGVNKWLMAHGDASEVLNGAKACIIGENIKYEDLEEFV